MKKVLITGATGFLGQKLYDMYKSSGKYDVRGTYNSHQRDGLVHLDVTNPEETHRLIQDFRPDIVIHSVALSDPDVCEQQKDDATKVNVEGTKNVVSACDEIGAEVDYISTVYVFSGEEGKYKEDAIPQPVNHYGKTKKDAEEVVASRKSGKSRIWRFDKLYGYNGEGKVNDVFDKFTKGAEFKVNNDQVRQPLLVDDVGRALMSAQEKGLTGPFHLAGPDEMSKEALTRRLGELVGGQSLVVGIPEQAQIARRPKDASIVGTRMEELGMRCTPFVEALQIIDRSLHPSTIEGQHSQFKR